MTTKVSGKWETVIDHACLLGEGPVWDAKRKIICWLDILEGEVHQFSIEGKKHDVIPIGQMIGCLAITSEGNFIGGLKEGIAFIDRVTGKPEWISNPENNSPKNRFNDGKCDPGGRFWAGTMALSEEAGAGNLYMIDVDRSVSKMIAGVTISNGLAWTSDEKTFYYIDTPTQKVVAYDYDVSTGSIRNGRTVIIIPHDEGSPDGMTIDSDDKLWIAHWDGWQVSRWDPKTGEKLFHISLPVARVTSCTFGGELLDDLYITTARVDLDEQELGKQPLAGSLFVIENCGYTGLPAFECRINK